MVERTRTKKRLFNCLFNSILVNDLQLLCLLTCREFLDELV